MRQTFQRGDGRFVAACLVLALLGGVTAARLFERAFPEASIQFTVNRGESAVVARDFLAGIGRDLTGRKHAAVFDFDDETKTYLERRLGLERAQALYGTEVRLWRWSHRWFRPDEKEELQVEVTAGGEIARFQHILPEEAPGAALSADSARAVAEGFLVGRMRRPLADWDYVEASSTRQPQRVDHTFTWKKRGLDLGDPDASVRIEITIGGDRPIAYDEYLDIPQAWQDDYSRLRAKNETASLVATLFLLLTVLTMIGSLVLRLRDRNVRWRTVVGFGAVAFGLQLLAALNQFDLEKFDYLTQDSYASFVTQFVLQAILGALAYGGVIVLFTAAAEPIYRERYPDKLSLSGICTRRGLETRTFFREMLLGLALMLLFAAYQSVFYVVAARYGAWAPLEVPYSNLLNTAIPWALVLFIGFFPAVSEEFLSRMFSVPFLDKHLARLGIGRRAALVLAVVLASYVWGFAHSSYPNQPFWIRGLEVGTAGIVVSFVMLRWGILATLAWHYTVDAFYTSMLMLRSGNTYFVVSGAVTAGILLVPLGWALWSYRRRGGFAPEDGLRNRDDPGPQPIAARAAAPRAGAPYRPIPGRRLWAGGAVAAVLLLSYGLPAHKPGEGILLHSSRGEALAAARAHMVRLGADPDRYRVACQLASRFEPAVGRYVLEHAGVDKLNRVYTERLRTPVWRVRFYRPDEREEFLFNLPVNEASRDSAGEAGAARTTAIPLWAFEHVLPDSAAGDTLAPQAAQLLASDFLRDLGFEPGDMELKESRSERQKSRLDYTFEWEVADSTLGEAGIRYVAVVRGGAVAGVRPYMHLPEAWLRHYERRSVLQRICRLLSLGVMGAIVFALGHVFVQQVRSRRFRWAEGLRWGAAAAAISLVLVAMRWESDFVMRYETTVPYQLFLVGAGISVLIQFVLVGLLAAVLVGTTFAVRPQVSDLLRGGKRYGRDAVLLGVIGVGLLCGVRRLGTVLGSLGGRFLAVEDLVQFAPAARPLPWLDVLAAELRTVLLLLPSLALLAHVVGRQWGRRWAVGVLVFGLLVYSGDGAGSVGEFGLQLAVSGLVAAVLAWALGYVFAGNDLGVVLAFLGGRAVAVAAGWVPQPAPGALLTGLLPVLLLLAVIVGALLGASRRTATALAAPGDVQESSAARSSSTEG
jgi:hypothetical protein